MVSDVAIEEWTAAHSRWPDLLSVVEEQRQGDWMAAQFDWHRSSHVLVAFERELIVGFLRFVTQIIGSDDDHAPVTLHTMALIEAKIMAFGVRELYRNGGIGRSLQAHALRHAEQLGCYQVRSHSGGDNTASHQLKLSMGFGVHPIVRGDDRGGVYFVMPLRRR